MSSHYQPRPPSPEHRCRAIKALSGGGAGRCPSRRLDGSDLCGACLMLQTSGRRIARVPEPRPAA
jgi:hypothetical protein